MKFTFFTLLFITYFFGFAQDTLVAKKSNVGLIAATEMNVVYRGVRNPIAIAVSHAKSFTVSGPGVSQEKGNYYITPGPGNEMVVTLEIILDDDSKVVEEHVFRIKTLKKHIARINNKNCQNCIVLMKKEELKDAEISFYLEDFLYDFLKLKVTSFDIRVSNKKKFHIEGNKITDDVFNELIKLKKGKEIIIYNIEFRQLSERKLLIHPIETIQVQVLD
jgi:hypothetical protein